MRETSALRYAEFCGDAAFSRYCRAGQVRLLAINETESVGPAMARYFASKLWQGEAHFMQIDAHTWFADEWDATKMPVSVGRMCQEDPERCSCTGEPLDTDVCVNYCLCEPHCWYACVNYCV